MGKLTALAVHGDAFVHQRGDGTILVDGGGSSHNLAVALVRDLPATSHLDVVVCTHADLDHANGLKTLLTDWRKRKKGAASVGEFWLPGRWLDIAEQGLTDPSAMMTSLVSALDNGTLDLARALLWEEEADEQGENGDQAMDRPSLSAQRIADGLRNREAVIEMPREFNRLSGRDQRGLTHIAELIARDQPVATVNMAATPMDVADVGPDKPWEPEWIARMREQGAPASRTDAGRAFTNARQRVTYRMGEQGHLVRRSLPVNVRTTAALGRYCLALIDAAEDVVEIARHAVEEGVAIRWFDHETYTEAGIARGGRPGFLLPMNSVELRSPPVARFPGVVFFLSLSKANRESLVFFAPAEKACRGVVFCADNRLGYGYGGRKAFHRYPEMATSKQLGTAPHHGAESADKAYKHAGTFGIDRWVCAGNGKTQPGPGFRAIATANRCCTQCPLIGKTLSTVHIDLDEKTFALPPGCTCV